MLMLTISCVQAPIHDAFPDSVLTMTPPRILDIITLPTHQMGWPYEQSVRVPFGRSVNQNLAGLNPVESNQ